MDEILKKRIETELKKAELAGAKVRDKQAAINWIMKKVGEGLKFDLISEKLKEAKYDFSKADVLLGGVGAPKAEEALTKVEGLIKKLERKEKEAKRVSLLSYALAAGLISGIAAYTAVTMSKATEGLTDESITGVGSFLSSFTKASWAVCVISGIAAVALAVVFFSSLRKRRGES